MSESMSKYLIHERPLTVQPTLIKVFGVEQAIILQQFHWLLNQPRTGIEHDGQRWIWGTYEEWCADYFPFWQARTLRYHINKLQKVGIIITKALRQMDWDRTNYYTIDYEKFDASIRQHVAPSNGQHVARSMGQPIAPSNGQPIAPSFKGTEKTTDRASKKTTERERVDPVARAATPTPPPATPPIVANGSKPLRLPNDSFDMPDSSNAPPPTVAPGPPPRAQKAPAKPATGRVDGRKFVGGRIPAGTGSNAVEIFYERHNINEARLSAPKEDDLLAAVTDLPRWRAVVIAWHQSDYKPTNIKGQLDWYVSGIPERMELLNGNSERGRNGLHPPAADNDATRRQRSYNERYTCLLADEINQVITRDAAAQQWQQLETEFPDYEYKELP